MPQLSYRISSTSMGLGGVTDNLLGSLVIGHSMVFVSFQTPSAFPAG